MRGKFLDQSEVLRSSKAKFQTKVFIENAMCSNHNILEHATVMFSLSIKIPTVNKMLCYSSSLVIKENIYPSNFEYIPYN